jgi:hypothetical protein
LTGFHSGFNDGSGEDLSMLAWANKRTWVTAEGATLLSNPKFPELMDQARKIFDGSSTAKFKNKKGEQKHEGLRTPWLIFGTPVMLGIGQTSLGDRFLRVILEAPTEDDRKKIMAIVTRNAFSDVQFRCNGAPESIIGDKLRVAYQKTGGFVDRLRERSSELLTSLDYSNVEEIIPLFSLWAEFAAKMRARPRRKGKDDNTDAEDSEELPSRLAYQFGRLASCLAVVMGRREVDADVLATIKQVALDVSYGRVLELCRKMWADMRKGGIGISGDDMQVSMGESKYRIDELTRFLRKNGCIEPYKHNDSNGVQIEAGAYWRLTEYTKELCDCVFD